MSTPHSTLHIDNHDDPPDAFLGESRCFICNKPTTGRFVPKLNPPLPVHPPHPSHSLYCSEECKNVDATTLAVGPLHRHQGCPAGCSSENCGSSVSSSHADFSWDVVSEPSLRRRHGLYTSARKSFSSMATSSESSSPVSAPSSTLDDQDIPSIADLAPPRSPFGIYPYPSPHAQAAVNGLPTPPLLALDGGPSPSLPPLLRYARRAFNTNVRASNTVSSPRHRRTPSGNLLADHRLSMAESAPSSAVTSPVLSAKSHKTQADTTLKEKKKNRRSLPMCFGALNSLPGTTPPPPPSARSTIPSAANKIQIAGAVALTPSMVISPSAVLGGDTASWQSGGSFHAERANSPDSATPTSLVTARLQSLALDRNHLRAPSPSLCIPSPPWNENGNGVPDDTISESMSAFSAVSEFDLDKGDARGRGRSPRQDGVDANLGTDSPPTSPHHYYNHPTFSSSPSRSPSNVRSDDDEQDADSAAATRLRARARGRNATAPRRASSPGRRSYTMRARDECDGSSGGSTHGRFRRRTEGRPQEFADRHRIDHRNRTTRGVSAIFDDHLLTSDDEPRRGRSRAR